MIRSDLGCYMETTTWQLDPKHFYIIKGDEYRSVTDLCTGANLTTITLHPDFKGGAFYVANSKNFFVIKTKAEPPCFECKCGENLDNASTDQNINDAYRSTGGCH